MSEDPKPPAPNASNAPSQQAAPSEDRCDPRYQRRRISRGRGIFWTCAFLMTVGVGVYLRAEIHRRVSLFEPFVSSNVATKGGTLLIVGGGQMSSMIRSQFIELAGGREARIVIIPAMAAEPEELGQFRDPWDTYDVASLDVLHAESRTQAENPEFSKVLETATAVWLSGGQQAWLSAWYGRTIVEKRLKELLARNGVIGGTSAGAAIMSKVMIAGGRQTPVMGHGFDLIPEVIIDQHFLKRNRFRRMQAALEKYPDLVGFGIDESTALLYGVQSGRFRVVGQSSVVACIPQREVDRGLNFRCEIFNAGDDFDMERLRRGDAVPPSYVDLDSILLGE